MTERNSWGVIGLVALTLIFTLMFLRTGKVWAQEVNQGFGIICNTPEQVAEFATSFNGNNAETLQKVNVGENVCGILLVAYVKGDEVAKVQTKDGLAVIVKIAVVALNIGHGWIQGEPITQYTMFLTTPDKDA